MIRRPDGSPLDRIVRRVNADATATPSADESLASGFPSVDKFLGGGFRRSDLIVLGGAVGSGKSSLALAMALRMSGAGTAAAFLTHEMSEERITERALAIEGRSRVDDIRRGTLDSAARGAVGAAARRLRERSPAFAAFPVGGTPAVAHTLDQTPECAVVFVDPLQALASGARMQDEELADAMRTLKTMAIERDVAVVVTSHLHVWPADRPDARPTLEDFGALGAVKQHADVVLGVYREEMYRPDSGVDGATELHVLKNRNGALGYVDLYFYKQWLRFEDMLDPES